MTYKKLLELEEKFTKKLADSHMNTRFHEQRNKLSKFFYKLTTELKSLTQEMGGDYVVLKEKGLDYKVLETFKKFRQNIIDLTKNISPEHPYIGSNILIEWINERMNKATLDNLNFIIQSFLKNNKIDFQITPHIDNISVSSLSKLKNLLKSAKDYIQDNPLLSDSREQSTVPPPKLYNVKEENFTPVSRDDVTIPGIPSSKKEAV